MQCSGSADCVLVFKISTFNNSWWAKMLTREFEISSLAPIRVHNFVFIYPLLHVLLYATLVVLQYFFVWLKIISIIIVEYTYCRQISAYCLTLFLKYALAVPLFLYFNNFMLKIPKKILHPYRSVCLQLW